MDCVHCDIGLDQEYVYGMTIDVCPKCGSIWFDVGELELFRLRADKYPLVKLDKSAQFEQRTAITLDCPKCGTDTLDMGDVAGYLAGRCTECHGVWLSQKKWAYPPLQFVWLIAPFQV